MYKIDQSSCNIHIMRNQFSRKPHNSTQNWFLNLPSMSLIFPSNEMWFLVTYLPTFSDNVTLFTVFFLSLPLFFYLFVSSWHVDIVPYLLSSTSYQVCSGVYSVHDFYLCPRVSHKTDVSGLWLCCRVLCRGPIPQYCYYLTPSSL